jgi:thioredoxin 1
LGPIVEKLAQDYAGKVKMAKLNVDENRATASQYRIMSIPTIIIFQNGQPVERISGLLPENQLKQLLDKVLAA